MEKKNFALLIHGKVGAWVVLGASLVLTLGAYLMSSSAIEQRKIDRFQSRSKEIEKAIIDRLRVYEQVLWGASAFVHSSEKLTRSRFKEYVDGLRIEKYWPGIQGIGYSIPVSAEEKESHERGIRREGFPQFKINPKGVRDTYSSIIYLEPFDWRNRRAFGYDMWSNPVRREAMRRARDEGVAAASGMITLVQETQDDVQPGFLLYIPVYQAHELPKTVEERRQSFSGWVYSPFRFHDLMKGILGSSDEFIEFEIFDGKNMSPETLLFDTNHSIGLAGQEGIEELVRKVELNIQGRIWTVFFSRPKEEAFSAEDILPIAVVSAGVIVDLLLFYVIFSMYFMNQKIETLAKARTRALEEAKQDLEKTVKDRTREIQNSRVELEKTVAQRTKELEAKIEELESFNQVTIGRESKIIEYKEKINELMIELGREPPYKIADQS